MLRTIKWTIGVAIVDGLTLWVLAWLLSGFVLSGIVAAVAMALIGLAVGAVLLPLLHQTAARLHPALFPVLAFFVTGGMVGLTAWLVNLIDSDAVALEDFETALAVAILLTVANTVVSVLFGLDDSRMYDRFVTSQIRRSMTTGERSAVPGVVFIQLDGLAEPILRKAISDGHMPTVQRWLESGSHRLRGWEPDLSSQTAASQAGIMFGNNENIPAFRWWDKPEGKMMVAKRLSTARSIEERLSTGHGLLVGGASRWNLYSGDADDTLGTFSRLGGSSGGGRSSYYAYLSNPYSLARTVSLFIIDVVREWIEAFAQRAADVRPRIHRKIYQGFIRAGTTVVLQEAAMFMLTADMYRGVPVVYSTLFGYDEVAHYAGIDRKDSLKVLRSIDRMLAHLECVAAAAPRPYHLVILSDHGQSQGATFRQRYGQTLGELVDALCGAPRGVDLVESGTEGPAGIYSALAEASRRDSRLMRRVRRVVEIRTIDGEIIGSSREESSGTTEQEIEQRDAIVVASGNLALISFPRFGARMTLEQITSAYPGLISGLTDQEGIGFVMVRAEADGGVVIGPRGAIGLNTGQVTGENPLAPFGPNAARHLARTDSFINAPDILVMSQVDPATGEVAAFEELVGCHGGLGGPQTQPFVLYPASLPMDLDRPIIGAGELHFILKSWVPVSEMRPGAAEATESGRAVSPASGTTSLGC
ncbi:MAG TPA: phage holin family protein [Thermomicrobiales bacterium]|nr:phage holin family protein [Thermomicrobiales bacterium]